MRLAISWLDMDNIYKIFNFKFWRMGESEEGCLLPPLSDCTKVLDENGEPQLKFHLPEGARFSKDKQDLLLAMAVVGEDLANMEGFEPIRFGIGDFKSPQLVCELKGEKVSIIVKVSRTPKMPPPLSDAERAMKDSVPNLYVANIELWLAETQDGAEAFFVNYRGLERVI